MSGSKRVDDGSVSLTVPGRPEYLRLVRLAAADSGARADLSIEIAAPEQPGRYTLKFDMVSEGIDWFESCGSPTTVKTLWVR